MIKGLIILIGCLYWQMVCAAPPPGFLWYNLPKKEEVKPIKPKGIPFSRLNFQKKDAVMAYYTREAWHKAMNHLTVNDMRNYIALQDFWSERATKTSRLFEKTMLYYPQYHYETTHPSNHLGVKIADERQAQKEAEALRHLAKTHGLFYFYRGNNPYDVKQSPILKHFAEKVGLQVMPISVDGVKDITYPNSKIDHGQARQLHLRFFPALILVNPNTHKTQPVSYGLLTQDMLARQFLLVATNFAQGDL